MNKRIKVEWLGGTAFAFFDKPADAHKRIATLKAAGFADARIVWPEGM